jgi:hypothetical protein
VSVYPAPQQTSTDPTGWAQQAAQQLGITLPSPTQAGSSQYAALGSGNLQVLGSRIYVGTTTLGGGGEPRREQANYSTIGDLLQQFYQMSPQAINKLGQKLAAAGQLDPNAVGDPAATEQAYSGVLSQLAKMTAASNYVTFDDYLATYLKQINANKPASYTNTSTQTNLTDPQSARQMLINSLQNSLGRDPTASEYQAFLSSVHAAERANPTVTKSTYKLNSRGTYDMSNQTSSGGVDPSAFSADYGSTHNQHEHAAYQSATTYFDALRQAVGAVV